MTVKYLLKNTDTNVIDMTFDLPVNASPPLIQLMIPATQFRNNMDKSIWIDVNNYKPWPGFDQDSNDIGEDWWESDGTDWVDNRDDNVVWERVRKVRNAALAETDWTQLGDADLTGQQKGQWTAYRNQLRSIPNSNPNNPRAAEATMKIEIRDNKPASGRGKPVGSPVGSPQ